MEKRQVRERRGKDREDEARKGRMKRKIERGKGKEREVKGGRVR